MRLAARLLVVSLFVSGITIGAATPASACSCASASAAAVRDADVVFTGTAKSTQRAGDAAAVRFSVAAIHKGEAAATQDVTGGSGDEAACGLSATTGRRYVVLAYRGGPSGLRSTLCGMHDLANGPPDVDLRAERGPEPGSTATVDLHRTTKIVTAGVALAAAATALVVLLRRRNRVRTECVEAA